MNEKVAQEILDKIVAQIFGYKNPYTLEQFQQKFLFDVRLPVEVNDSITGESTWAQSANPVKFITMKNSQNESGVVPFQDFTPPPREMNSLEDVLAAWNEINYTTTERYLDSLNVFESDNIYESEMVYRSLDVHYSKNILFSDGAKNSEFVVGSQRSNNLAYSARVEDSTNCSNSFSVSWSANITNSLFISDAGDMYECMFCSHTRGKRFCIANIQMEEEQYYKLKKQVIEWILST